MGLCLPVHIYRHTLRRLRPACCRFYPSCSEYALETIKCHSPLRASLLILVRLLKCHPLHPGGYDPVNPNRTD